MCSRFDTLSNSYQVATSSLVTSKAGRGSCSLMLSNRLVDLLLIPRVCPGSRLKRCAPMRSRWTRHMCIERRRQNGMLHTNPSPFISAGAQRALLLIENDNIILAQNWSLNQQTSADIIAPTQYMCTSLPILRRLTRSSSVNSPSGQNEQRSPLRQRLRVSHEPISVL